MTDKPKPMHPRQFTVFELLVLITAVALLVWVCLGLSQHNGDESIRTQQQQLFDESDLVAIVTADAPKRTPNTDDFIPNFYHQCESRLTVQAVLKGEKCTTIQLVHFVPRRDVPTTLGNGPTCVWMGTEPTSRHEKSVNQKPQYLVFLRLRDDERYEAVSGNRDPVVSIIRLLPFPEWDPAMETPTKGNEAREPNR